MFLRDCTNLEVSRTSKILRRYFRREGEEGREVTSRFLESTFLDFQRNYYPCINYNPSQGSLLYSESPEHCQYLLVPSSPSFLFLYEYTSRATKIRGIAAIWKSRIFSITQINRNLKTSLSKYILYIFEVNYVTFLHRDFTILFYRIEITIPIACFFPHSLSWRT